MTLTLYNTLTRTKAPFEPEDPARVGMYVCGPTVYDDAHIGNARPIIVFDLLFRLLRHTYGPDAVTYVRNITDVDDKINARARDEGISITELTARTTERFHVAIARLGVLPPTVEPTATGHIEQMKALIEKLVRDGHAYAAEGHVLFSVDSFEAYGALSRRSTEDMEAGARVEVAPYKRDPMDFVLWKPSKEGEPSWPSPCGIAEEGRPGWHIECSAMAREHLGETFDIHGGGIDLAFPHHENELAQSCAAHGTDHLARVWMHNGFLQVEGEKMSKSLGNFITISDLLDADGFGGTAWHGKVLRWAMLSTHYRQPIDWTVERLVQARSAMIEFAEILDGVEAAPEPYGEVVEALADDLNTPRAMSILFALAKSAKRGNAQKAAALKASLAFMGVYDGETRDELRAVGGADDIDTEAVEALIAARLEARSRKDFGESDRLRDELAALGVRVKDGKDPETGKPMTTWEVA